jgi:hypothetical protein
LSGVSVTAYAKDVSGVTGNSTASITAKIDGTIPVPSTISCSTITNGVPTAYPGNTTCMLL